MRKKEIHPKMGKNVCYVAHQGIAPLYDMFDKTNFLSMTRWPESGLTIVELAEGRKFAGPVLTESPWIISNYDNSDVYIWRDGQWKHPENQTYGASVNNLTMTLLGIRNTIPGDKTLKDEIKALYR
jgi:hypothetical protein